LEYFDEWKDDPLFLKDILEMLDNVLQYFIDNAPDTISRARYSAMRERSVGVGSLGFHAYLQKNSIAFEGVLAKSVNNQMFYGIRSKLDQANLELAQERGACPDAGDFGVMKRCSHVMAIAPNASSSIIMGNTSPSIEPFSANAYRQDTTSGAYLNKNKFLDKLTKEMEKDFPEGWYEDTWASIVSENGSIQHLDCFTEIQKDVYKTAREIDQRWIIEHSADRQKFVDQAISTNVFFSPDVNIKYLHAVHFQAWKQGLKSLYYLRADKLKKADKVGQKVVRKRIEDEINLIALIDDSECLACSG
jgi:ribonucleoside-diphosphate reductase alpha chain